MVDTVLHGDFRDHFLVGPKGDGKGALGLVDAVSYVIAVLVGGLQNVENGMYLVDGFVVIAVEDVEVVSVLVDVDADVFVRIILQVLQTGAERGMREIIVEQHSSVVTGEQSVLEAGVGGVLVGGVGFAVYEALEVVDRFLVGGSAGSCGACAVFFAEAFALEVGPVLADDLGVRVVYEVDLVFAHVQTVRTDRSGVFVLEEAARVQVFDVLHHQDFAAFVPGTRRRWRVRNCVRDA